MKQKFTFKLMVLFAFFGRIAQAQQLPLFNQYREYSGLINPGSVTTDYLTAGHERTVGLSHRRQWKNVPNEISTQLARFEWFNPSTKLIMGGYLLRDVTGPSGQTGGYFRLGYIASPDPKQSGIGLGLQIGLSQYRVRVKDITFRDEGDVLAARDLTAAFPDVGVGIFAYTNLNSGWDGDKIYGGISMPQTFGLDLNARDDQNKKFKMTRVSHFYGNVGMIKSLRENFVIEPSVWLKYVPNAPLNLDFNLRAQASELLSFGVGFGTSKVIHTELTLILGENVGIENNRLKIGYAHDTYLNKTTALFGPSHEINFTFSF
jgi:type IX secretion system PorP/SprF family membrane protein